ncbi:hypothetical protein LCGC14_2576780 [marine sediment metagenome]|uniref:Bacteriophage protein gp37 n=1 Tax=marine sediment metagenome TaxID=412755 RepID=A0A0F9AG16_9ZZZZ
MNRTPRLSKSAIDYLDYVWNFASGCTKGCTACWAKKRAARFHQHYPFGFQPTVYPEALLSPLHLKKASIIGCVFMGDLFDDAIDPQQKVKIETPQRDLAGTAQLRPFVFDVIENCPQHRFLFLTKQPQNLAKWAPFPRNAWVGVSVTDSASYQDACTYLGQIEGGTYPDTHPLPVRFISFEPLLGAIYTPILNPGAPAVNPTGLPFNWVIIGAQTKPTVMPKVEWVKEIVEAADQAGIPVFLKNSLKASLFNPDIMADHPNLLRTSDDHGIISVNVRQEMPTDG